MTKCHARELEQVLVHLLEDAADAYPAQQKEFARDRERLLRLVESRGIHALVVDLPKLGKHLDRCLANGEYKLSGLPLSKRYSNRVVIPKLFRGLHLLVFHETGSLKEDYDVEAVYFLRQLYYVGKKAALACSRRALLAEVEQFFTVDNGLPSPDGFWNSDSPNAEAVRTYRGFSSSKRYRQRIVDGEFGDDMSRNLSILLRNLDAVSRLLTCTLGPYRFEEWRFRHGPGAVSDGSVSKGLNKYSWVNWSNRLDNAFPIACCGFHNYAAWSRHVPIGSTYESLTISSNEPSSKLVDVPKTITKPRLIACEPREHQWCQQNIWHYFCDRTKVTWISKFVRFRDQTLNQDLCRSGSLDGSLITVDLSAASDRVTCHFVGQLFRVNPALVLALQASRTRSVRQEMTDKLPSLHELRKFATMGSSCTFPVQSIGFLAIVLATTLTVRGWPVTKRNILRLVGQVAVFGDDLIAPKECRELLYSALEVLDFKVNTDKSYDSGRFRESCGLDAMGGVNVSPAYWRAPYNGKPDSLASTVEVANNFRKRWLLRTSAYIASSALKGRIRPCRVGMRSGVFGLKSFASPPPPFKIRWNADLQRMEANILVPVGTVRIAPIKDDTSLLQYFTEAPSPTTKWKGGVRMRPRLKLKSRWVPLADMGCSSM